MNLNKGRSETKRIAIVWLTDWMQAQETLNAICKRADREELVTIQHFNAKAPDFVGKVLRPMKQWKPHGVIIRILDPGKLKCLRHEFPGIPFVSPLVSPSDLVNTCVTTDITDIFSLARDYFRSRGIHNIALYCTAVPHASATRVAAFRKIAPDGPILAYSSETSAKWTKAVKQWVKTLPKPSGVIIPETCAASAFLLWSQEAGIRIPEDIQVIGVDDADVCLACEPHLTSIALPNSRIGDMVMDAMLRHLRKEKPIPHPVIMIPGCTIITRSSTSLAPVGHTAVKDMLKLINTHAKKGMAAAEVARSSGVALTTFYRHFGAAMGLTPARHMRQLRLKEACRMLQETPATVTAIAAACGFNSVYSFIRCFRRETGQTPSAYRKQMTDPKAPRRAKRT